MENCIICKNVSKSFCNNQEKIKVIDDITLSIQEGEFVLIGGRNGSGKSTLLKIIIGLLLPDSGEVEVLGKDVAESWKKLSVDMGVVLSSDRSLYWKLTGEENLYVFGKIYGVKKRELKDRINKLLSEFNLDYCRKQLVENYSTGMKRKLMICKALINNPRVIIADELLNGLDPQSYMDVINILIKLNKKGITIIMVTHILHDMPKNSRVILLKSGNIVFDDRLEALEYKTEITISATIDGKEIKEISSEECLSNTIINLTKSGAKDLHITAEDVYSITRRYLT